MLQEAGCGQGPPRVYIYDAKAHVRVVTTDSDLRANPWKRSVALDITSTKNWLHALFVDPATVKKSSEKQPVLMRKTDLLMLYDGRSQRSFAAMSSEIGKIMPHVSKELELPSRHYTLVRRMYHNKEFRDSRSLYATRSSSLNAKSAEPLEIVFSKTLKLALRSQEDIAGQTTGSGRIEDNRCRAWSDLAMKAEESQLLSQVSFPVYESMLGSRAGGGDKGGDSLHSAVGDADEDSDNGDAAAAQVPPEARMFVCPWEAHEDDMALAYHLCRPEHGRLVILTPGSGESALAAVRAKIHATLLCENGAHKQVVFQTILLKIVVAMISGNSPGFSLGRRVLSRVKSLNGDDSVEPPKPSGGQISRAASYQFMTPSPSKPRPFGSPAATSPAATEGVQAESEDAGHVSDESGWVPSGDEAAS